MTTGAMIYPPGYVFFDGNGVPLNAGKLYSYRTGTSTAQDLHLDSTLSTALSNPIILDSSGRATSDGSTLVAVYADPSSGFDFRLTLKTSADVTLWTLDDIVVPGADTATLAEGSFTGTLTGMDASTTGTVRYRISANSAGTGKVCRLYIPAGFSGTSNTTAMTLTGIPAACAPTIAVEVLCSLVDNGTTQLGLALIAAAATTATFLTDLPFSATGFTGSGTKGLSSGWQIEYAL